MGNGIITDEWCNYVSNCTSWLDRVLFLDFWDFIFFQEREIHHQNCRSRKINIYQALFILTIIHIKTLSWFWWLCTTKKKQTDDDEKVIDVNFFTWVHLLCWQLEKHPDICTRNFIPFSTWDCVCVCQIKSFHSEKGNSIVSLIL